MSFEKKLGTDREILIKLISQEYNTYSLNKQQYSRVINRSIPSIDRDRANSRGASFKKDSAGNVYYPVTSVADYLLKMQHTMDSYYE